MDGIIIEHAFGNYHSHIAILNVGGNNAVNKFTKIDFGEGTEHIRKVCGCGKTILNTRYNYDKYANTKEMLLKNIPLTRKALF